MKNLYYILILVAFLGCNSKQNINSTRIDLLSKHAEAYKIKHFESYKWKNDTSTYYWEFIDPKAGLMENRLDTFLNQWFSYFMTEFDVHNYSEKYGGYESYRILWLRTFHNPIVIEIQDKRESVVLNYKISDGAGGYEFGNLKQDTTFIIDRQDWNQLTQLIKESDFWNLTTDKDLIPGCDGSELILEAQHEKGYHMIHRWGGQEIGECGRFMIELSKIKIPEDEFY